MDLTLHVWRQASRDAAGSFQTYAAKNWAEEDKFDTELIAQTVAKLKVTSAEQRGANNG